MPNRIIIMADILGSSEKRGSALMRQFEKVVEERNQAFKAQLLSPLTITLGDEFQGIPADLSVAIQILFSIEETIIAHEFDFKLRYVINEGDIDTKINKQKAYGMLGKGLTKAREQLEALKKEDERFWIGLKNEEKQVALNNAFILYQWLVDGWKTKDFPLITAFFQHEDYKIVAEKLNKDVSLMWRREQSLHLKEYYSLKKLINYVAG